MAVLETAEIYPNQETQQAANGRIFYETDQYVFEDLAPIQRTIAQRTADILDYSTAPDVETEIGMEIQHLNLADLDAVLLELSERIGNHSGWLTITTAPSRLSSTSEKALLADYHVKDDDQGRAVLFVPTSAITAHRANPQFYATGHATRPVMDMRIKTSGDPEPVYNRFTKTYSEPTGRWVQFALAQVELGLLQSQPAQ